MNTHLHVYSFTVCTVCFLVYHYFYDGACKDCQNNVCVFYNSLTLTMWCSSNNYYILDNSNLDHTLGCSILFYMLFGMQSYNYGCIIKKDRYLSSSPVKSCWTSSSSP